MRTKWLALALAAFVCGAQALASERDVPRDPKPPRRGEGEREGPRLKKVSGEITAIADGTVELTRRGDQGEKKTTLKVDAATKVRIPTGETETVKGEGGAERQRPKMGDGTLADLKVGQRVSARCAEDGKAVEIVVAPPKPPRRGGEGEGEKPREPKPPRRGEGEREF